MKIAAFSDLHSNLAALEAILEDIERLGRNVQIVIAGDFLNFGPFPRETLAIIRALPNPIIISGNHEGYVVDQFKLAINGPLSPPWRGLFAPSVWTATQLTAEEIGWLEALPEQATLTGPDNTPIKIVHGSPRNQIEGLHPEMDDEKLEEIFQEHQADRTLWISGHTHRPFHQRWRGMTITNNGSAGAPLDGDNRPCYLVAEWDEKQADWHIEHRRPKYDLERMLKATLANAVYDQAGPFMKIIHSGLKVGLQRNIAGFNKAYIASGNFTAPPEDFAHLDEAIKVHLAQFE